MYAVYIPKLSKDPVDYAEDFEQAKAICKNFYSVNIEEEIEYEMTIHPSLTEELVRESIKVLQNSYITELENTYQSFKNGQQNWFGNLDWLYFKCELNFKCMD